MPFVAAVVITQSAGAPSIINLADTSTGSDGDITGRRVYLRKSNGLFLVPTGTTTDYILWDYADSTIDIDTLDEDMALDVIVEWINVSGAALYQATSKNGFTSYNEDFDYYLTTMLAANPLLINDNSFRNSKSNLRLFIDSGDNAITRSSDIEAAQLCYTEATKIRLKSEYYFNEST